MCKGILQRKGKERRTEPIKNGLYDQPNLERASAFLLYMLYNIYDHWSVCSQRSHPGRNMRDLQIPYTPQKIKAIQEHEPYHSLTHLAQMLWLWSLHLTYIFHLTSSERICLFTGTFIWPLLSDTNSCEKQVEVSQDAPIADHSHHNVYFLTYNLSY